MTGKRLMSFISRSPGLFSAYLLASCKPFENINSFKEFDPLILPVRSVIFWSWDIPNFSSPSFKKEIKLKYELEKNVNLVKFENNRIEISFNESLNKDFVKELSSKLFEWTNERWIITFSKLKGERSIKDQQKNIKEKLINDSQNSEIYKDVINNFPDAELINVESKDKGNDHD